MNKRFFLIVCVVLLVGITAGAQQKIDPKGMTYIIMPKPNNIIYHDTVYKGYKQIKELFYRTQNPELISLMERHQTNKIVGGIINFVGTIVMVVGISETSASHTSSQRSTGWIMAGGGFLTSIAGGYLMARSQQNMVTAVTLFNQKYHQASLGIGISQNTAGLVYKF